MLPTVRNTPPSTQRFAEPNAPASTNPPSQVQKMLSSAEECGFALHRPGLEEDGNVLFFGQVHYSDVLAEDPEALRAVVESQHQILDDLLRIKPERVFQEGQSERIDANQLDHLDAASIYCKGKANVAEHFGNYEPGQQLTREQQLLLLDFPASNIYLFLSSIKSQPGSLMPTTTPEDASRDDQQFQERPFDANLIFGNREPRAMGIVQASLKENPGVVGLIFGEGHKSSLPQACAPGFSPKFYYKDYAHHFHTMLDQRDEESWEHERERTMLLQSRPGLAGQLDAKEATMSKLSRADWINRNTEEDPLIQELVHTIAHTNGFIHFARDEIHAVLSYVNDSAVRDEDRCAIVDALAMRLDKCGHDERGIILRAMQDLGILEGFNNPPEIEDPRRTQDPRIIRNLLVHICRIQDVLTSVNVNHMIEKALKLPEADRRQIFDALDDRTAANKETSEEEKQCIKAALEAQQYKRQESRFNLPF